MSKLCVFMADGSEEVETLAVVDIARRAGIETELVSVTGSREVTGSHRITVLADTTFEAADFSGAEALYIPGGLPGVENLCAHAGLRGLLLRFYREGRTVAALCAAPGAVFGRLGIVDGRKAACFPGFAQFLEGAQYLPDGIVTDGNVTTGRGLGFAIDMGLELVRLLVGEDKMLEVKAKIQHPECCGM